VLALVAIGLAVPATRTWLADAVASVSWVVFAVGLVLAWRFKRSTLALAFLVLGLATFAIVAIPLTDAARAALAILVPLDLAVLAWLPERRLFGAGGHSRLAVLGAEVAVIAFLLSPRFAPIAPAFALPLVPAWGARAGELAQPALLGFALALGAVTMRLARTWRTGDAGLWSALVAAALGLASADPQTAHAWLSSGALVLLVATVEASYGMAYGDELTGLPSRRALDNELRQLAGKYAIAMADVDHFKKFNDEHGHPVGDQLLRMVARELGRVGGGGRAFRYGGEEFAILFRGKTAPDVLPHLEAAREVIAAMPFVLRGDDRPARRPEPAARGGGAKRRVHVTVSIGVAAASRKTNDPRAVLDAADAALYRAKDGGRNRVEGRPG
jgi:GGDEF domain-containing protein